MARRIIPTLETSTSVASAVSKDGALVDVRWAEDIEGSNNRGFVSHEMSAWVGGQRCGYLRVGFVSSANLEIFLPTPFHYLSSFGGGYWPMLFQEFFGRAIQLYELSDEARAEFVKKVQFEFRLGDKTWETYEQLQKLLAKNHRWISLLAEFEKFKAFHLGRPLVDYINTRRSTVNGVNEDNRGRGIGFILYMETARHLATMGLRLHASGCQSEEAAAMWRSFSDLTQKDGDRRFIDPSRLPKKIVLNEKIAA